MTISTGNTTEIFLRGAESLSILYPTGKGNTRYHTTPNSFDRLSVTELDPTSCLGTNLSHEKNAWFHGRVFKMCQISRTIHGTWTYKWHKAV